MSDILNQKISIIGAGRVGSSLAHALKAKGIMVNEVYSRSITRARKLSTEIPESTATNLLDFSQSSSHFFILAISDDSIEDVSKQTILPQGAILAHTSGTVSLKTLKQSNTGIFYPLQTFTTDKKVDFRSVPILIDGKNENITNELIRLARILSKEVKATSESERQQLHIAAVFASNFTNRMLAAAKDILKETTLDLKVLEPLVFESIQNVFQSNPDDALTGPAKRGDVKTIENHLQRLNEKQELQSLYEAITKMITSRT